MEGGGGRVIWPPRVHVTLSRDIFGCHNQGGRGGDTGIKRVEIRDAGNRVSVHRKLPQQRIT